MMVTAQFGGEIASNIVGALIAARVVSLLVPRSFALRGGVVLLMGIFGWLSISASHYLWYRFPGPFVRDELLAAMLEWGVAGLAIAAIVKPCGECSEASEADTACQTAAVKAPAIAK